MNKNIFSIDMAESLEISEEDRNRLSDYLDSLIKSLQYAKEHLNFDFKIIYADKDNILIKLLMVNEGRMGFPPFKNFYVPYVEKDAEHGYEFDYTSSFKKENQLPKIPFKKIWEAYKNYMGLDE